MPSKTFAAVMSACSRTCISTFITLLMLSGSLPSTSSCSAFLTNGSPSRSITGSSPSRPCLRAVWLHSTMRAMSCWPSRSGGRITHEKIASARRMTCSGVCTRIAAIVPTTTIMNAAAETRAMMPAPLRTAPTRMAQTASTRPRMLRMSKVRSLARVRQAGLEPHQRLSVELAGARFGHLQHFTDLLQVQPFAVVQRHDQALALGQLVDGLRERIPQLLLGGFAERIGLLGDAFAGVLLVHARQATTDRVVDDAVVFLERDAHVLRDLRIARVASGAALDLAHRRGDRARLAVHRARRPVECAQRIDHRAANTDSGVGLEARAAGGGVIGRRLHEAEHSRLDEIVHRYGRRQPTGEVIGNTLDELAVARDELIAGAGTLQRSIGVGAHRTTCGRGTLRRTSRSTKNSMLPRGPSATGQRSTCAASFLKAFAAGLEGDSSSTERWLRIARRRWSSSGISPANSSVTSSRKREVTRSKRWKSSAPVPGARIWLASTRSRLTP